MPSWVLGRESNDGLYSWAKITKEVYKSQTAIIGTASSPAKLEQSFMNYVDGLKINGTRPYFAL